MPWRTPLLPAAIVPWLPIDRNAVIPNLSLVDPFPFRPRLYAALVAKLRNAVVLDSKSALQEVDEVLLDPPAGSGTQSLAKQCLLAAVFTVNSSDDSVIRGAAGLQRLREYVLNSTPSLRADGKERPVFEWFACGCPLGNVSLHRRKCGSFAHLAIRAISQPGSWLFCAMCMPQRLAEVLLPRCRTVSLRP